MAITPQHTDYSTWYLDIVAQAGLAEHSAVRGCMVIKPYGYALRDNMRIILDRMFKNTGHKNAYFPLFIPKSYLSKEAQHVEGFAKECAVVTHYRLRANEDNTGVEVDPDAKLEEELVVRPTSETIIWHTYKNWIQSHRDLPLLINQRANVVRWELRTRLFLRTAEFLRQEGHTAHATAQDAIEESRRMLDVYYDFVHNFLGMYAILGEKPAHERFAGAEATYTLEPMMQDGKALQAGTSHFLGQNFAKAFDVMYTTENNTKEYVWATSRGVSTRMIGGLIMAHSDDKGLVLPPAIAPLHIVIIPIAKTQEDMDSVREYVQPLLDLIKKESLTFYSKYFDKTIDIECLFDDNLHHGFGRKATQYELQGVPIRLVVGKKEMESGCVEMNIRRSGEKKHMEMDKLLAYIDKALYKIQNDMCTKHKTFSQQNTIKVDSYEDLKAGIEKGFVLAHRDGTKETAEKIQTEIGATIRCLPFDEAGDLQQEIGTCVYSGKPSQRRVVFAKSY